MLIDDDEDHKEDDITRLVEVCLKSKQNLAYMSGKYSKGPHGLKEQ